MSLTIVVHGASGRMGRELCALVEAAADLRLAVAQRERWPDVDPTAAVVIDFSLPEAMAGLIDHCRHRRLALVSGTTGLSHLQTEALRELSAEQPVLWAANFSLGIALLRRSLDELAARLPPTWDCALLDLHHRHKRDAPSGTARVLAQSIDDARVAGAPPTQVASVRVGEILGEHRIVLAGPSERIELSHHAEHRRLFAEGALLAARWLVGRPAGWYGFDQVVDGAGTTAGG